MNFLDYVPFVGTIKNGIETIDAAVKGDGKEFAKKGISTLVGGTLDVMTLGSLSVVGKGAATIGSEAAITIGNKMLQKEASKVTVNVAARVVTYVVASKVIDTADVVAQQCKSSSGNNRQSRDRKSTSQPARSRSSSRSRSQSKGRDQKCDDQDQEEKDKKEKERKNNASQPGNGPGGKSMIHKKMYKSKTEARDAAIRDIKTKKGGGKHDPLHHQAHGKVKLQEGTLEGDKYHDYVNKDKMGDHYPHFLAVD